MKKSDRYYLPCGWTQETEREEEKERAEEELRHLQQFGIPELNERYREAAAIERCRAQVRAQLEGKQ